MAQIRPSALNPAAVVSPTAAIVIDDGVDVAKATPLQVLDAARPLASQADAEGGTDNVKIMSALRVKQALASLGAGTQPVRIDAPLSSTWVLANPLGRVPVVQVFLASGEMVLTDVDADDTQINVTFPTPQQGFVLAF